MKNILLAIFFVLFFLPTNLVGQKSCQYDLYYYSENSLVLKFECDSVEPFIIRIFSNSDELLNEISYKPLSSEKTFLINCDNLDTGLVISILYPENSSTFISQKK